MILSTSHNSTMRSMENEQQQHQQQYLQNQEANQEWNESNARSNVSRKNDIPIIMDLQQQQQQEDDPFRTSVSKYKEEMRKRRLTNNSRSHLFKYTVDKVQGILLPQNISSYLPVSIDDDDRSASSSVFRHPSRIPLIKGLERVTSGAQPASEVVATCGMKPHRFIWFIISGCICDVIQFFIDLSLFNIFKIQSTTICWVIGYALSIIFRHSSHRFLVFGNYVGGYWSSLLRMYTGYSISLVFSTLFNLVLTGIIHLKHYTAWIMTLIAVNIFNYFLLRYLWSWDWSVSLTNCGKKSNSISSSDTIC